MTRIFAYTTAELQALIIAISAPLIAIAGIIRSRRKTSAETSQIISEAAGGVVKLVNDQLAELKREIDVERKQTIALRLEVRELKDRVRGLESEATKLRRLLNMAKDYARLCLTEMRKHNITPPVAPEELELEEDT